MSDNTVLNPGVGGDTYRDIDKGGVKTTVVTLDIGGGGAESLIAGTVPVSGTVAVSGSVATTGGLTDAQLRATTVPVSGTVTASGPLTDTQLRASAVPISGTVTAAGPLTDTQLRATAVPVSGTVTATGPLTDTQLRATAVPVSGTVTANAGSGPFPVSDNAGSLTVDAPVGTPLFARLSDGTAALTTTSGRLSVDASGVAVPITDNAGSLTVDQPTGTNLHTVVDSGTITTVSTVTTVAAVTAITNALPAGTNTLGGALDVPDATATYASSNADSTALEASHVVKGTPGVLYGLSGYNSKTSAQFIQVFNSTTVPADTTVPVILFLVQAGSNFSYDTGRFGKSFATGIAVSNSSTAGTKTVGAADCWFNPIFK